MTDLPPPSMPTVDAIWAAWEAENDARGPAYDGYGISASALGRECDRDLWYGLRWASPPEKLTGRKLRIFARGNLEEGRVLADLRRAGLSVHDTDPDTGKQWRFAMANGFLRGKADGRVTGVIEAPKADHVLEIKSAKAADWRGILKHGLRKHKPDHWHQLHSGMAGLGINRGLYIAVNKDTEEILTERLHLDVEEAARQEARVLRIVDADDAPTRASDKPDAFVCRFCQHKATCHDGAPARRSCRTCLHFRFTSDGNGHCERFDVAMTPKQQKDHGDPAPWGPEPSHPHRGGDCPTHLFLPSLVAGEQIDADPEAETITYRMNDGSTWTDGAQEARNA